MVRATSDSDETGPSRIVSDNRALGLDREADNDSLLVALDNDNLAVAVTLSLDSDSRGRHLFPTDSDNLVMGQGRLDSDKQPRWVAVADKELVGSLRGPDNVNLRFHADENASQAGEVTQSLVNDRNRSGGHLHDNDTLSQVGDNDVHPPSATVNDKVRGTTSCDSVNKKTVVCLIGTDSDRGKVKGKDLDSDNSQRVAPEAQQGHDHEGDKNSHSLLLPTQV